MDDFKGQLAAIRNKVRKGEPLDKTSITPRSKVTTPNCGNRASSSKSIDLALAALPMIGVIADYEESRGFGTISSGHPLFFHASTRLPTGSIAKDEQTIGRHVLFMPGSSPRDQRGRARVVRWCFLDEIRTRISAPSQDALDAHRANWFESQTIEALLDVLRADWYVEQWRGETAPRNLHDEVFRHALLDALKALPGEKLATLNLRTNFERSPYEFTRHWLLTDLHFVCGHLVTRLSPEQLVAFGTPKREWFPEVDDAQRGRIVAWALLSDLTPSDRREWEALVAGDQGWAAELAETLASSKWHDVSAQNSWVHAVLESAGVAPDRKGASANANSTKPIPWFDLLSRSQQLRLISEKVSTNEGLVELLRERSDTELISAVVASRSISVDLESGGASIWEIGTASSGGKRVVFKKDQAPKLSAALDELACGIASATLVVGHNLLRWDWPILKARLTNCEEPVIWDTLLVEALIRPWVPSLALGGSHRADDDAAQAFELFQRQLSQLPPELGLAILSGEILSSSDLMSAVVAGLDQVKWNLPVPASWVSKAMNKANQGQILLLPGHQAKALNWCPRTAIVSATDSEPLELEKYEVSLELLLRNASLSLSDDPFLKAVAAIVSKAARYEIRVRLEMLPVWLRKHEQVETVLQRALAKPSASNLDLLVATHAKSSDWCVAAQSDRYLFLTPPPSWAIFDRQLLTGREFQAELDGSSTGAAKDGGKIEQIYFRNIGMKPDESAWLVLDRTIKALPENAGPWRRFKAMQLASRGFSSVLRSMPGLAVLPRLLSRRTSVLHPGAEDQAGYWKEVLRTLAAIRANAEPDQVPLLLVGSSWSKELLVRLQHAMAEVAIGEVHSDHHSRSERLRRARRSRHCLVDSISNWLDWRSLAEQSETSVCPVIEAVPLEEWYAANLGFADTATGSAAGASIVSGGVLTEDHALDVDEEDSESTDDLVSAAEITRTGSVSNVSRSRLLEIAPQLTKGQLEQWLWTEGFADYEVQPIVIDGRLSARGRALRDVMDLFAPDEFNFDPDQATRLDDALACFRIERQKAPDDYESFRQFLADHWNKNKSDGDAGRIENFRATTQRPAIEAIRGRNNDVVVTLPTGEGKSVLFQVPALCRGLQTRRLTLVISPLRALMRDQVERLGELGFQDSVDYLSGDRLFHETEDVFQGILNHRIVLLYVAPERFRSARFLDALDKRIESDDGLEYVVVDEAHCVSQWGYEFRPDYFHALNLISKRYRGASVRDSPPFILLSATITSSNRAQLEELTASTQTEGGERRFPFVATPKDFFNPLRSHIAVDPRKVAGNISVRPREYWPIEPRLAQILDVLDQASKNFKRTGQHSAVIIFVTRRDHAEELASRLRAEGVERAEYFHAGLDAGARQEVYEQFRTGQLDVLVATKAFGMGMDIPHIHWAIHLSPPAYLEDYLQEVGRIGRGAEERTKAGLDELKAVLLFSEDDFQSIRSRRAEHVVAFRQVADWYDKIRDASKLLEKQAVAIVPDAGFDPPVHPGARRATATQLRIALYWMERIGRITLEAMVAGLLPVTINVARTRELARTETGPLASIANSLVELVGPTPTHKNRQSNQTKSQAKTVRTGGHDGWLGSVLRGLAQLVGLVFGQPANIPVGALPETSRAPTAKAPDTHAPAGDVDAVLNIATIWQETDLSNADEVLGLVAEMEQLGALKIRRTVSFSRRRLVESTAERVQTMFDVLEKSVEEVTRELGKHGRWTIDFEDLEQRIGALAVDTKYSKDFREALEWSLTYLLRQAGARVRQRISAKGVAETQVELVRSSRGVSRERAKRIITTARHLWPVFRQQVQGSENTVAIATLISAVCEALPGRKFREFDLRRATGLLSKMRLVSMSESMMPMSYVLSLSDRESSLLEAESQEVWEELATVNRLSELRCLAMEIYAHLPTEARNNFINEYFTKDSPDDMEAFLDGQLGEMVDISDHEDANTSFIARKREELRAQAVEEFFSRYRDQPQEPNQWLAIQHPFDQHLLVNAGPGSGKTSVLLARVAHLIRSQHLRPEQILVLSFNRAVVFEIRTRIRELFSRLGYGAYVRRLNAYTFHAFATRHMDVNDESEDREARLKKLLPMFADRLEQDSAFRTEVAGGFRAILVDEFQDTNRDIYRIITQLARAAGSRAGVMVIGDDDQDILTWNRFPPDSSTRFFEQFAEDFSLDESQKLILRVNFRSGPEIVDHSQTFLAERLHRIDGESQRLKQERLSPANGSLSSRVAELDAEYRDWETVLLDAREKVAVIAKAREPGSLAILCRTNAEVASAYIAIQDAWPGLAVQASDKSRAARLRHFGLLVDLLRREAAQAGNRPMDDGLRDKLLSAYTGLDIPEVRNPPEEIIKPEQLWELCCRMHSYPYLSDFIGLIEQLDLDELMLLLGTQAKEGAYAVVSTIHKVKGLEFDRVMILPSSSSFVAGNGGSISSEAAAEARLMYVAMTRAKRSLRYYLGPREKAWISGTQFRGAVKSGHMLQGTPAEVALGWAWSQNAFNPNPNSCQSYIEREVAIGDKLEVGGVGAGKGKALLHRNSTGALRQIGFLANRMGAAGSDHDLIVSSVIRYPVDPDAEARSEAVAPCVRERGWGYVVVPAGVLR